ncbi:MAG TPA: discoidin domain-containing protein, partial [Polyangia bacterium]|nr:discoidin domain-containing protein [Polyangia bacterium]
AAPYDWLQFYGDSRHSGNNTSETVLSAQSVPGLTQLFKVTLPAKVDGAPAVLTAVSTGSGVRDLVFMTSQAGHILAVDAHSGATIWSHQNTGSNFTTSAPAIDPSRAFVYSYGLDGKVHKYAVGSGTETTTGGWPQVATLKPSLEKGITSLATVTAGANTFLYIGYSGYGDGGDYQGHLTTINLTTGTQKVFNTSCSDQTVHFVTGGSPDCPGVQSAIWGRSGVVYHSATGKIYATTGNGTFNPGGHLWGDSVLALNPDGSGTGGGPVDSYTPSVFQTLQDQDLDLGSTAPVILPNSGTKFPHIAVQGGKDQQLRIINLDNLSGQGGPGHVGGELFAMTLPQGGDVTNGAATWTNPADNATWVFITSTSGGLAAFKLLLDGAGNPSLATQWMLGPAGGSVLVANNVLYNATNNNIRALNPATGAQLWSNGGLGTIHWQSPVVANGVLYIADNSNQLTAFAPNLTALSRTGWTASASSSNGAPGNALDGNATTRWSTGAAQANGQFFIVDMKVAQTFSRVTLDAGTSTGDYPRGYQLFVSNDGTNWGAVVASGTGAAQMVTIDFAWQTARFLRVVQTGSAGNWWSIHELNVLGVPPGSLTPLPRTGWVASATPSSATDVPARALDGNASTRFSTGAAQTNGQMFQVDMQTAQTFSQLTLDAGTSTGDFPRGYQVFVSNDGTSWGSAIATGNGSTQLVTITFTARSARFVRVVQTGTAGNWWSIHEFNVWH